MAALALAAARAVSRPAVPRPPAVRMLAGGLREPLDASEVEAALDPAVRAIGSRRVPTVAIRGLWACGPSPMDCVRWLGVVAQELVLRPGEDFEPDPSGEPAGGWIDAVAAKQVARQLACSKDRVGRGVAGEVLRVLGRAIAGGTEPDAVAGADRPVGTDADADGGDADAEPWADAFDFGRLVPVAERELGGLLQQTVSARDVHRALGSGRKFTTWVEDSVRRCSLVDGVDVVGNSLPNFGKRVHGGQNRTEVLFTLHAAKKVAMAAVGRRGNAVREYFIECERRLSAGERPIAAPGALSSERIELGTPDRAPAAAAPWRLTQDTMPLAMADFLVLRGLLPGEAAVKAAVHEPALRRSLAVDGAEGLCCPEPLGGRWVFARPALDAWWAAERVAVLAISGG